MMKKAIKNQSELKSGHIENYTSTDSVLSNSKTDPNPQLISFQDLPQLHKELFLSRYGLPHTGMIKGDRTFQEKDILSDISVVGNEHQNNPQTKRHHNLETSCRLLSEIPLSRTTNSAKSGNKTYQQQCLAVLYDDYSASRRLSKTRPLSRSQFYEVLLQRLKCHEQNVGIPLLCRNPNM